MTYILGKEKKEQCVAKQCISPDSTLHVQKLITKPVRNISRYQPSHFVHTLFINATDEQEPVHRDLKNDYENPQIKINLFRLCLASL